MDGVIVDNHTYHVRSWAEFCTTKGIPFDESTFREKFFGKNTRDTFNGLLDYPLTEEQINTMGEEKEKIYRDLYRDDIAPVNGLIPFLIRLKEAGIKTAVATSAPTSNLDFTLDNLKIRYLFDVVVDASGVTNGKPDPEIYLKAARLLAVSPAECVVFEDSISGIKSGQNADMRVVALATTHAPDKLPETHLTIKDFTEISIERINQNQPQ
jgi:HAD superfamily hydrolase (TIGR01509 family)